jgi:hypothetical protein
LVHFTEVPRLETSASSNSYLVLQRMQTTFMEEDGLDWILAVLAS